MNLSADFRRTVAPTLAERALDAITLDAITRISARWRADVDGFRRPGSTGDGWRTYRMLIHNMADRLLPRSIS